MIENQEFVAMRAAQKSWPTPTTTEEQLRELVSDGLIQSKAFAEWRVPGEHRVPALGPGEIVLLSPSFALDFAFPPLLFFINFSAILGFA